MLTFSPVGAHAGMTPVEVKIFEECKPKAEKGDMVSEYMMGEYLSKGFGTSKDEAEAAKWYLRAAHQGLDRAQHIMGQRYFFGEGVIRDIIEAYAYSNLAAANEKGYRWDLDNIEKMMSPEAILRGQQRTRELQREIEVKIAAKKAGK